MSISESVFRCTELENKRKCLELSLQAFDNIEYRRTGGGVANGQRMDLVELLPIRVRIFATGLGAVFVDEAIIVCCQKRAGHFFEHIVVVFVDAQIGTNDLGRLHAQSAADAFDVLVGDARTERATTVGTLQAIGTAEFLFVQQMNHIIQLAKAPLLDGFKKRFALFFYFLGPFGKGV